MKRILFFTAFFFAVFVSAQTLNEYTTQMSELIQIAIKAEKEVTRDSVVLEIQNIIDKSQNSELEKYGKEAIFTINELSSSLRDLTYGKDVEVLSKDDLKNLDINHDKFRDITFIHYKHARDIRPYLSLKAGVLNMRLIVPYSGKDWIFFDKITFLVDSDKIEVDNLSPSTKVGSGYVYETADFRLNNELINFLEKAISSGKTIEYRLSGKRVYDSKLSNAELKFFNKIFDIYNKLKN